MIIRCDSNWLEEIFDYISDEYERTLYIYVDIKKYGLNSEEIIVWVDYSNDKINLIIMLYHTGMHLLSKEVSFNELDLTKLIEEVKPTMIFAEEKLIFKIKDNLTCYKMMSGTLKKMNRNTQFTVSSRVKQATLQDIPEMTKMLFKDKELMASYSVEEMENQLRTRMQDVYGRSFIISDGEKIIAQASTAAEIDNIAIVAAVITDQEYRGQGLFGEILNTICYNLAKTSEIYLYCYGDTLSEFYDKYGFYTALNWGKLYIDVANHEENI